MIYMLLTYSNNIEHNIVNMSNSTLAKGLKKKILWSLQTLFVQNPL